MMISRKSFSALLLMGVLSFIALFAEEAQGSASPATNAKDNPLASLSPGGMMELPVDAVVCRVYDKSIILKDFHSYLMSFQAFRAKGSDSAEAMADDLRNGLTVDQQKIAKNVLFAYARQQCLLHFAQEARIQVTEEEKANYISLWLQKNPEKELKDFNTLFPDTPTNPMQISRDKMFCLMKYTDALLKDVVVPPELLAQNKAELEQEKVQFEQMEAKQREEFRHLSEKPGFNTDEGFKKLAKQFSDGAESVNGGVIADLMSRKEIRECNGGQPFKTKVGESSELFETESSLRYIRVLEEVPGQMAGEPPKLRIAQILFAKRVINHMPTDEEILTDLRYKIQEKTINAKIADTLRSDAFECPLFPTILDDMLQK